MNQHTVTVTTIAIDVELQELHAHALAKLCKVAVYEDLWGLADSDREAYEMLYALRAVARALTAKGFKPR